MSIKLVKSVARVIEILELYNEVQEPLAAVDVAERLGYPLASTHEILKTLLALGYFSYGNPKWTYRPSSRFHEVLEWVQETITNDPNIFTLMEALNNETQETINLSQQLSRKVKIVRGLECLYEIGVSSRPGTTMKTTHSLTGIVSLAHLDEIELKQFYSDLKHFDPDVYRSTDLDLIEGVFDELREKGCAFRADINISGIGAVCCPIISSEGKPFVIGVVGPSNRIQERERSIIHSLKVNLKRCSVKSLHPVKIR